MFCFQFSLFKKVKCEKKIFLKHLKLTVFKLIKTKFNAKFYEINLKKLMCCRFVRTNAALAIIEWSVVTTRSVVPLKRFHLLYWKDHYALITCSFRLFLDITKHWNHKHVMSYASVTFHMKKFLRNLNNYAFEPIACRWSMYFWCHVPIMRKSNSISKSNLQVDKRNLSFIQTFSPSVSLLVARWNTQFTPRRTNCF